MKIQQTLTKVCFACALLGIIVLSCEDPELEDPVVNNNGNNGGNNIPTGNFTSDELSEFLSLKEAKRITGTLPEAPDLQLKINYKDTLYLMKNMSNGIHVEVRHFGLYDITGFYIAVENSSFYYDVPVMEEAAQDSSDVFFFNMGIAEDVDMDFPYNFPIKILPHDQNGDPLDAFDKEVTIENPEAADNCSFTHAFTGKNEHPNDWWWSWDYTLGFDYNDEVFYFEPNSFKKVSSYPTGGCCNLDGTSSTVANDPYCFEKYSDGSSNPNWRSIDVTHYFQWIYDVLWFYDNGQFGQENLSMQTNYRPSKSDFCKGMPAYDQDINQFIKTGTHDFSPGADYLTITYDVTDPPVFGKIIRSGNLEYTCNLMVLSFDLEGQKWEMVFRKYIVQGTLITIRVKYHD